MSGNVTDKDRSADETATQLPHLGQLFLRSNLITEAQLDEVCDEAHNPLPRLGQKLVLAGYISHAELHDGLHVQCLLREKAISEKDAINALRMVREQGIVADEAITKLQVDLIKSKPTSRFGDLLVDAGIVTKSQLEDALARAESTNLPLGQILTMSGLVSNELLFLVTDMQNAIREKAVDRDKAILALSAMALTVTASVPDDITEAITPVPPVPPVPPLHPEPGPVPPPAPPGKPQADNASPAEGAEAAAKLRERQIGFADFMVLCGVLQKEELDRARKMCDGTNYGIETVVKKIHGQKNWTVELAGYCFRQMARQTITLDQGIYAFDFCKREIEASNCTVPEAATKLSSQVSIDIMAGL
jgi:hypothetical protein